ncbi:MAG: Crp/Fnr family transcriptional regulator [Bacteroidota bacterium]
MKEVEQIRPILEHFAPLTDDAWGDMAQLFTPAKLKKGEYFVRAGDRNDALAFILDGALRAYYIDQKGVHYNKTFFVEHSFAVSIASVLQDIPSYLFFDALVDTRILKASYRRLMDLFPKHRCLETVVRKILEYEWIIKKEQRELRLVMNDAAERYAFFQEEYPGLENKIPQYHIASHLGITPIQLSRIRAKKGITL